MPTNILWAIETEKTRTATTVRAIVEFLTMRLGAINTDSLIIDEFVNQYRPPKLQIIQNNN